MTNLLPIYLPKDQQTIVNIKVVLRINIFDKIKKCCILKADCYLSVWLAADAEIFTEYVYIICMSPQNIDVQNSDICMLCMCLYLFYAQIGDRTQKIKPYSRHNISGMCYLVCLCNVHHKKISNSCNREMSVTQRQT